MALITKSLDSGYDVRLRPVPPYAISDVIASFDRPKYPMLQLQSEAGPSETAKALEDSPEWHAWNDANTAYNKQCTIAIQQFMLTYGVLDYRKTGTEDDFVRGAPVDWAVPADLQHYGVKDSDDKYIRWSQFIKYVLIVTEADDATVTTITDGKKPVDKKAVDDAITPFDSSSE